ncbi:MAG: hypothetical protein AAF986_03610 [Pseudomonadota bacterium]
MIFGLNPLCLTYLFIWTAISFTPAPAYGEESKSCISARESETVIANFPIYDATLFHSPPASKTWGAQRLTVIYESGLLHPRAIAGASPRVNGISTAFRGVPKDRELVCINIESWMHQATRGEISHDRMVDLYIETLEIARRVSPDQLLGFYSIPPIRNYWDAIRDKSDPKYQAWANKNNALERLGFEVDIVFPSLYTFYNHPDEWEEYARRNIEQARNFGKPVVPFIWFNFHNSNNDLAGKPIPPEFWRRQLELCLEIADGVVIWGGFGQNWDPDAPWLTVLNSWRADNGM